MIRTEKAYKESIKRLKENQKVIDAQKAELQKLNLSAQDQRLAMAPILNFNQQIHDEIRQYEKIQKGDFSDFQHLGDLGQLIIAIRISKGLAQRDLAEKLGVSEAQVSRDERNEYFGITKERAIRIIEAMGQEIDVSVSISKADKQLVS